MRTKTLEVRGGYSGLVLRGNVYQFRKAIPQKLQATIGQREYVRSLNTNDPSEAMRRYQVESEAFNEVIAKARMGIRPNEAPADLDKLISIADGIGLPYRPASEMAKQLDIPDLMNRLRIWGEYGKPKGPVLKAMFGELDQTITITRVLDEFIHHIRDETASLNPRELKKKLNPKRKAISDLINSTGKDDIKTVNDSSVKKFFENLKDRVAEGHIKADTANKTLDHLRRVFAVATERKLYVGDNPFQRLSLKAENSARPGYSTNYIRDHIMAKNALDGLDDTCRAIVFALIDTGAILKELCGLDPVTDIRLDAEIPHIIIQPNRNRKLKAKSRGRKIPLIGLAAKAFERYPRGFEKYVYSGGSEAASSNINKFLVSHNFFEETMFVNGSDKRQTTYSFRHTFKDRLRAKGIVGELQDHLMGHTTPGMGSRYGRGYELDTLLVEMRKIENDFGCGRFPSGH